ncbi:hypothetical protein [Haloechinothrix sp. LS1_15]|uniref:Rv1733c family protein n=1 Tax=Haloechinothrix sp. LS1_15 TaxID=2652248 RepID=UPI002948A953|nr:hypothetical protein [Haloechinothrix sp. LS1_15]MDV6014237.1 hypothetical protein [Haloechinothrix sp. LS1_15]
MRDIAEQCSRLWRAFAGYIQYRWGTDRLPERVLPVLLAAVLLAIPVAMMVASAAHDRQLAESRAQHEDRSQVAAVLLEDARPGTSGTSPPRGSGGFAEAHAIWPYPRGPGSREGAITVRAGSIAGDEVRIWVDPAGQQADPPLTVEQARARATGTGLMFWLTVAGGSVIVFLAAHAVAAGPRP